MLRCKMQFVIVSAAAVLLLALPVLGEQTWRLAEDDDWKQVSAEGKDKYLLTVAEIKRLVNTGETKAVSEALEQLKKDFPKVAGADLDTFIQAELLFCEGKFSKAFRRYEMLLGRFPGSEFYEAALEREFSIGTAFLGGQKRRLLKIFKIRGYAEGERIMDKISDRAGDAPIAVKAAVAVAQSCEKRKKFDRAYHKWSEISSRWPTGQIGRDALLGMARCKHAAYEGPSYNATDLISARSYYEKFKLRYPEDAKEIDVDGKIERIDEQLAYKQFSIGRYYDGVGNKQSANFYYRMVLDNWPESRAA